ncbi:MAG: hypothetical protein MJ081_08080 [Ruminococcus sp.]|nr:hypothetical protein [Ruminococcus sp.]
MNYCKKVIHVLLSCCDAVYHNEANQEKGNYIIWHEVGVNSMYADNSRAEKADRIAVDFFTKEEFPDIPEKLERAFSCHGMAFQGPEIIYHEITKVKQYAYTIEVI